MFTPGSRPTQWFVSIRDGPANVARQLPALDRSEALRLIGDKPPDY